MATDVYIDPQWTGTQSGTLAEPYDDFPGTLNSDYNYWLKRGSWLERSTQVNFDSKTGVTVGAYYVVDGVAHYDDNTALPKPKWSCYETSTSTGDWADQTGNVWKYDDSSGVSERYTLLGLGRIGDMLAPSWTERAIYSTYGGGTATPGFDTYGQWDRNEAANSSDFVIYSANNPVTDYGTIYFASSVNNPCLRISCNPTDSTDIVVENIHFLQAVCGIRMYNTATYTIADVTVHGCIFDHCYAGLNVSHAGTLRNVRIINNYFNECANVAVHMGGDNGIDDGNYISGNIVLNTGRSESVGGIYGPVNGGGSGSEAFTVIENNYVDTIFGVTHYWNYEQRAIYLERMSQRCIVRNNICRNAHNAGLHINTGSGPNYMINNLVIGCNYGMEDSDSNDYAATSGGTYNYWLGNTCVDCASHGFVIGRTASSTDAGTVVLRNNVFISEDGNQISAVKIDSYTDDLGLVETPDFCIAHGYSNLVTRGLSTSGLQTTPGSNFISADPLLDGVTFAPSPGSPCINASCGVDHVYDVYGGANNGNHIGAVWPGAPASRVRRDVT